MRSASVGIFCFDHWLKNVGVSHGLGNKKGIALLKSLWEEQKGICAVTGEKLAPGSTASLDHIIPKSRGGASEKGNLRWVTLRVNQIKWDMTHEEFVEMCRTIVREQDRRLVQERADHTMRSN
jgi:5-methylcytosine-specific restriction endonuclease McrA